MEKCFPYNKYHYYSIVMYNIEIKISLLICGILQTKRETCKFFFIKIITLVNN